MSANDVTTRPKKKIKVILLFVLLFIVIALFSWNLAWKMSGSGQWQLDVEGGVTKVYSLKAQGSSLKKIRAITRVKARLNSVVAFFQDPTVCEEFGCKEVKVLEQVNPQLFYMEFQYPFPAPLMTRQFVTKSLYYQDPTTKTVHYFHTAAPEKAPPDSCCFRVTHFYVVWTFTPLKNGEVEIEMMRDLDAGGFMPDFLLNLGFSDSAYELFSSLQSFVSREKYKDAKISYIEELPADQ